MRMFLMTLALLGATPATALSPIAEVICDQRSAMVDRLHAYMRVEKQGAGMRDPDSVMELWANEDGDWTLVVARADGTSCIVAMGEHWQSRPTS